MACSGSSPHSTNNTAATSLNYLYFYVHKRDAEGINIQWRTWLDPARPRAEREIQGRVKSRIGAIVATMGTVRYSDTVDVQGRPSPRAAVGRNFYPHTHTHEFHPCTSSIVIVASQFSIGGLLVTVKTRACICRISPRPLAVEN